MQAVWAKDTREPVELGTVLVSPRRIPGLVVDEGTVPANATVITARDIAQTHATTVQDALSRAEGIAIMDTRGFGLESDSTVNLRGIVNSSRTNVLVLVDGVRQNRITGDEVHWQSVPVEQIERIEIIRGGGGTIYGEGALAGVINIVTKQGGEKPLETEEGFELGSFGWQKYHLAARGRSEPLTYGVSYTRRLVDGHREFSWSRNTTITAHSGLELKSLGRLAVNVLHSEDTTAFAGGLTLAESQTRREQAVIGRAGIFDDETDQVSTDLIVGPWEGFSGVLTMFWRKRLVDSLRSGLFTITPSQGLSLRSNYEWGGGPVKNLFINGIELMDDKATTGTRGSPPEDESHRKGYGLYVEDTLTLLERLSLVGGLRFDKFRYEESLSFPSFTGTLRFEGFSPKAGITYAVVPKTLDVFAAYSRPFKAPNVDDFAAQVPDFAGNVDLQPQQADTYELGTRLTKAPLSLEATWFYTRIDDEILFNRLAGAFGQNQNFDTRRKGVELAARFGASEPGVRGSATYTLTDAEFRKGAFVSNTIPGTPTHLLNVGVGVSPVDSLWIDLDWQLVNDYVRINDFANTLPKADNYGVLNLTIQYERPSVTVFFKIQNLTNEEYVAFQASNASNLLGAGENPMPPISFVGGITLKF